MYMLNQSAGDSGIYVCAVLCVNNDLMNNLISLVFNTLIIKTNKIQVY
jgi:hypothetical protein